MRYLLSVYFLVFFHFSGYSQTFLNWQYNDRYFSVSSGTGWSMYFGELNHNQSFEKGLNTSSLSVEARLYSRLSARINIQRYKISGSDTQASDSTFEHQRNLSFFSTNYELSLIGQYYFKKYAGKYHLRRNFEPYLFLGVGGTFYSPKATLDDKEYNLREHRTEDQSYSPVALIIPAGVGVKAKINAFIDLILEAGFRYTFTDYLDDVSDRYVAKVGIADQLANRSSGVSLLTEDGEIGPGHIRGNPKNNDHYLLINLQLSIYLPHDLLNKKVGQRKKEKFLGKPSAFN